MLELIIDRKLGIDSVTVAVGARDQLRQVMIVLRSDHKVDRGCPADDFFALGLGDATGDGNENAPVIGRRILFQSTHAAELGIDLLGRLLPDVAGVEDDQIGVFGGRGLDIAFRRQGVRHTL